MALTNDLDWREVENRGHYTSRDSATEKSARNWERLQCAKALGFTESNATEQYVAAVIYALRRSGRPGLTTSQLLRQVGSTAARLRLTISLACEYRLARRSAHNTSTIARGPQPDDVTRMRRIAEVIRDRGL